jgi:transposase
MVNKLFLMSEPAVVIMDRTNWKWGKKDINILMVSIEHFGIGIPIYWMVLNKGGSSSFSERTQLLKKVLDILEIKNIKCLLADREFIGDAWFQFLVKENIPFIIRVKSCFLVKGIYKDSKIPINRLLRKKDTKARLLHFPVKLWSNELFASVEFKKTAKEPLIVVSNQQEFHSLNMYRWRWAIETFFGCLKSRGFRLEDTHMTSPAKIEKLLFILAIAFCYAYKKGELQSKLRSIKIKKHKRKQKSIFRLGLDLIRRAFFSNFKRLDPYFSLIEFFDIPLKDAA